MRVFIIPIGEMGTVVEPESGGPVVSVERDSDGQRVDLCRESEIRQVIPINSIVIPDLFVDLCEGWHGSINCKLYAVSSTGGLTIGAIRPLGCDTTEKWYLSIWRDLSVDVAYTVRCAEEGLNAGDDWDGGDGEGHDADYPDLAEFEEWVDAQVVALEDSYGLADWEGE
jgi:hypothetical protein